VKDNIFKIPCASTPCTPNIPYYQRKVLKPSMERNTEDRWAKKAQSSCQGWTWSDTIGTESGWTTFMVAHSLAGAFSSSIKTEYLMLKTLCMLTMDFPSPSMS